MSAFTYDDWNNIIVNYKNKFGVYQNTNSLSRLSTDFGFKAPWYSLHEIDVNDSLYTMADVWCRDAAASIDTTRTIWSQETLDEIDVVMSGGRCGFGSFIRFIARGNVFIPIINTVDDPIFEGRMKFISMAFDVEALNNITWPDEYINNPVQVYYTANFTRSPAPNLIWTSIWVRDALIGSQGHTDFINRPIDAAPLIYNVSSYTVTAKYRVIGF